MVPGFEGLAILLPMEILHWTVYQLLVSELFQEKQPASKWIGYKTNNALEKWAAKMESAIPISPRKAKKPTVQWRKGQSS